MMMELVVDYLERNKQYQHVITSILSNLWAHKFVSYVCRTADGGYLLHRGPLKSYRQLIVSIIHWALNESRFN